MTRRHFAGAATPTRLLSGIGAVDTSFGIQNSAGWPTGGANGPFSVIFDPDTPNEEHVLVTNQTGGTCSGVTRGVGDTTAKAHAVGSDGTVIHGTYKADPDEANRHINDVTIDEHTQYMKTDGTRHDLSARHAYGGAYGTRPTPVAIGTALAAGSGTNPAAGDHVHVIGAGAINNSNMYVANTIPAGVLQAGAISNANMFGAGVVDLAAIGPDAVGNSELVNLSVDSNILAAASVIAGKIAAGGVSATNQITDGIISLAKFLSEAGTNYGGAGAGAVGPWTNTILGTGGLTYARHFKLGRIVIVFAGIQLGTGGDFSGPMALNLPFNAASISGFGGSDAAVGGFVATRAWNQLTSVRVSGTGVISTTQALNFVAAFQSSTWSFDQPFDWSDAGSGSKLQLLAVYEATA